MQDEEKGGDFKGLGGEPGEGEGEFEGDTEFEDMDESADTQDKVVITYNDIDAYDTNDETGEVLLYTKKDGKDVTVTYNVRTNKMLYPKGYQLADGFFNAMKADEEVAADIKNLKTVMEAEEVDEEDAEDLEGKVKAPKAKKSKKVAKKPRYLNVEGDLEGTPELKVKLWGSNYIGFSTTKGDYEVIPQYDNAGNVLKYLYRGTNKEVRDVPDQVDKLAKEKIHYLK